MKKYFILLTALIVLLNSCQKEIGFENTPIQTSLTNPADTVLLRKFIFLDPTQTAPNDTFSIANFSYDNLKRCTKITAKNFNGDFNYTDYSYNNTDTLIKTLKTYSSASTDSTKEFFSYSSSGQLINDSLVEYTGASVTATYNYDFSSLNSLNYSFIRKNSQPYSKTKHVIQNDLYGNIIAERDTSFLYNSATNSYDISLTNIQTISYDNKNCPFYKFAPAFPVGIILGGGNSSGSNSIYFGLSKHRKNITQEIITILTPTSGHARYNDGYQYIYNALNYPTSVIMTDVLQNKTWKGLYFY